VINIEEKIPVRNMLKFLALQVTPYIYISRLRVKTFCRRHKPNKFVIQMNCLNKRSPLYKVRNHKARYSCPCTHQEGVWRKRGVAPLTCNISTRRWGVGQVWSQMICPWGERPKRPQRRNPDRLHNTRDSYFRNNTIMMIL
jgi:hypothetical protein